MDEKRVQVVKRIAISSLVLMLSFTAAFSHIGSPGVTLEGEAGPYRLMVLVNPPDVIPGVATVDIFLQGQDVDKILIKPVYWYAGSKGTPRADLAMPVEGEPGHYSGELWLMSYGTSSVEVVIEGEAGTGSIVVPVMAVSTAKETMEAGLGYTLSVLGVFLVILMITILALGMSDSKYPSNDQRPAGTKRKKIIGAIIGFVILSLVVYGGKSWWDGWANSYDNYLYEPWQATSTIIQEDSVNILNFHLDSMALPILYKTRQISYLVPDHGKIMHMFLVREGSMDAFAHVHPKRIDTVNFQAVIPPLPAGKYLVYADISRLSGFSETVVDTVILPEPISLVRTVEASDADDTYFITDPADPQGQKLKALMGDIVVCGKPGQQTSLPDGSKAVWEVPESGKFYSDRLYSLTFSIFDEQGEPAELEPYLGMMGHAVVLKNDGSVYIHLHPVGNYSTASQQTLLARFDDQEGVFNFSSMSSPQAFADSIDQLVEYYASLPEITRDSILMEGMDHDWEDPDHPDHAVVKFPYSFPSAGDYRIFIQMKRNGRILNAAFDVTVEDRWE